MRQILRLWPVVALCLGLPAAASGLTMPKATPEGKKSLEELLRACEAGGGFKREGEGPRTTWRVDPAKLRAALTANRERLTPELRETLVAGYVGALFDAAQEGERARLLALLTAVGDEAGDDTARGFAAFFTGIEQRGKLRLPEAAASYERAVKHFAGASNLEWQALSLNNLGGVLRDQGEYGQAKDHYAQALEMYRRLYPPQRYPQGHPLLATSLNNLGSVLENQGEYGQAGDYFAQALEMRRKLYPPQRYPHGHPDLATSLNSLGSVLRDQGEYRPAKDHFTQALEMRRRLYPPERYSHGHPDLAGSLNNLGLVLQSQGEYGPARDYFAQALEMRRKLYPPERYPQGHPDLPQSLNNLGSVLENQGEYGQAGDYFAQALEMRRKLYPPERYPHGHPLLALCLNNLGLVLRDQGEYGPAKDRYAQALEMRRKLYPPERYLQGHPDLAGSLNNLGAVLEAQGEYGPARDYFTQALEMQRKLYPPGRYPQGHPDLATSLNNLGTVLQSQGEYGPAKDRYAQALEMRRRLYPPGRYPLGHPELALSLNNLAGVQRDQGEYGQAKDHHAQALEMYRRLYPPERYPQGHPLLALSLSNLGSVLRDQGEYGQAGDYFAQALEMRRSLYPPGRYPLGHPDLAGSFNSMGLVLGAQGEFGLARDWFVQALQNLRTTAEPVRLDDGPRAAASLRAEPTTLVSLSNHALTLRGSLPPRPTGAEVRACERACALGLAVQDRLRGQVRDDDSKLTHGERTAELVPVRVGLFGWLFVLEGHPDDLAAAFATVEQGRARVFLESLGKANAARLAGLPPADREEEDRLRQLLGRLDAETRVAATLPGPEAFARLLWLNQQRLQGEQEFRAFEDRLAGTHSQYASLRFPRPCSVENARRCLAGDEVALLFAVGADESFAVVLHKQADPKDPAQGIAVVRLPGRRMLADKVEAITNRERLRRVGGTRSLGAELYCALLGPLAEHIRDRHLVIVPDGPLCLLPFELLVEPDGRYLVEHRRVRYAPSLTALHMIRLWEEARKQRPDRPLVAFGDPVFDAADARLKSPQPDKLAALAAPEELARREGRDRGECFCRLAASGREVRAIANLLHAKEAIHTDADATEARVKKLSSDGDLARARYVHFATHGVLGFDRGQPPALVLTLVGVSGKEDEFGRDDGLLTLPEVSALKLNADLVVLSACRTGQGRMRSSEGVSGLARVFLYAGSRGVACSLWSVDDDATADLMRTLYERLEKGDSAAEALRAAKLALIADGQPPLCWAPFILMGR